MRLILDPNVPVTREQVEASAVFKDYAARLDAAWQGTVTVTGADYWGGKVRALQVDVADEGNPWPIKVTLRSETVDVLVGVTDGNNTSIVFVEQYRPATGTQVVSNVAGGLGWDEPALAGAARELQEELGLGGDVPFTYTLLLSNPTLPTPGLTNERAHMVKAGLQLPPDEINTFLEGLRGKRTGLEAEGERIVTHVVPAAQARKFIEDQPNPDAKTLLSLLLAGF